MLVQFIVVAAMTGQGLAAAAPSAPPVIVGHREPKVYADTWKRIADDISNRYYGRKTRKFEMEKLLLKYGPLASAAKDDTEFEARVEEMIREFGDSHFDLFTRADQGYYMMDGLARGDNAAKAPEIGAWFRQTTDGYRVQMVLEGTEASKAGLRVGDRIVTADDAQFGPITSFAGKEGKPVKLAVERGHDRFEKTVVPESDTLMNMFLNATRASARTIDAKGKKLAYVHVWTLGSAAFKNALESLVNGRFATTDAFILDLRDGFGGRPEGYGDPFFRPGNEIKWDFVNSTSTQHFGYSKPLVVLINVGSRSAKELLSFVFKSSHRATLIGTQTAGNVLGTSPIRVNDWSYLELPAVDVVIDGVRLEKNGVQPDIKVEDGFDKDGKDVVIERAVQFLSRKR
ncbi:MAG TPA: S41 family peptidase [Fimbriimonadaceae bacterium]|nr:S41 family peptidase [Fimbriimonadaceae bacterium]